MQLIIFSGVQASGKSTFYLEKFYKTHLRINLDMLKTRHREKIIFQACILGKAKCVIDNTNPTAADRAQYIQQAKHAGFEVIGYFFETDLKSALKRNQTREGKACIAEVGVRATYKNLERPCFEEGFDLIYNVKILENQQFSIEQLQADDEHL